MDEGGEEDGEEERERHGAVKESEQVQRLFINNCTCQPIY
jgi:hypothetical protein